MGIDRQAQKKLQRSIGYLERDIEKLEEKIKASQLLMADPEFYQSADADQKINEYKNLQQDLESKMTEWERLQTSLD